MNKRFLGLLVLALFVFSVPSSRAAQETYLTILHTNDTHSTLFPYGPGDRWGGIARLSGLVKELKAERPNVLVLNSGDVFVGTFEFNKYLGYPELKIMESLYDAMCLGNHEFDLGLEALLGVVSGQLGGGMEDDCRNPGVARQREYRVVARRDDQREIVAMCREQPSRNLGAHNAVCEEK